MVDVVVVSAAVVVSEEDGVDWPAEGPLTPGAELAVVEVAGVVVVFSGGEVGGAAPVVVGVPLEVVVVGGGVVVVVAAVVLVVVGAVVVVVVAGLPTVNAAEAHSGTAGTTAWQPYTRCDPGETSAAIDAVTSISP